MCTYNINLNFRGGLLQFEGVLAVRTPMGRVYESGGLKRWMVPTRPKHHDSQLR